MNVMTSTAEFNWKAAHIEQVRDRIRDAALATFCRRGLTAAVLDDIMGDAGLARAAFSAYFASKDALFLDVIASRNALLRALERREGDSVDLWHQMRALVCDYLDPHNDGFRRNCVMVNLAAPAAQHSTGTARAVLRTTAAVQHEIVREQPIAADDADVTAALSLVLGAAGRAVTCKDAATRTAILTSADAAFRRLTSSARLRGRMRIEAAELVEETRLSA